MHAFCYNHVHMSPHFAFLRVACLFRACFSCVWCAVFLSFMCPNPHFVGICYNHVHMSPHPRDSVHIYVFWACFLVFFLSKCASLRLLLQPCSHVSAFRRFRHTCAYTSPFSCCFTSYLRALSVFATTMFTCLRISQFWVVFCYNHVHMSPHLVFGACSFSSRARFGRVSYVSLPVFVLACSRACCCTCNWCVVVVVFGAVACYVLVHVSVFVCAFATTMFTCLRICVFLALEVVSIATS